MQIKSISTKSFKGIDLYPVNIKTQQPNGAFKVVPAHFVELDCFDNNDCDLMLKIRDKWIAKESSSNYALSMCKNFFHLQPYSKRFFAIQLDNSNHDKYSNTVAIMETTNPEKSFSPYLEIDYLQSATSLLPKQNTTKVKGAGEQLICGAVKLAKEYDLDDVAVLSTNDEFYEKLGLTHQHDDDVYYRVLKQNFSKFINKIEEKYK